MPRAKHPTPEARLESVRRKAKERALKGFFNAFDSSDPKECWIWARSKHSKGYGAFRYGGRFVSAHVFSYEYHVGPVPDGLCLDHTCRNPACVNPAHLEPVTNKVNCLRGESPLAKNARKTHCDNGHEFTPENTISRKTPCGMGRKCRKCKEIENEERKEARKRNREARGLPPFVPGREMTHCKRGHPFGEENTTHYTNAKGYQCRGCKTCQREAAKRRASLKNEGNPPLQNLEKLVKCGG